MRRKTEAELMRAKVSKIVRNHIRLKHALAADEEINEALPEVLARFDRALQSGKTFDLDTKYL